MEADEKTLFLKNEKALTARLRASETSASDTISILKKEVNSQKKRAEELESNLEATVRKLKLEKKPCEKLNQTKTSESTQTGCDMGLKSAVTADLAKSFRGNAPSISSIDLPLDLGVDQPQQTKLGKENLKFFKGKVFLKKVSHKTIEPTAANEKSNFIRHQSKMSATSEELSVISSIQKSRKLRKEQSYTLDDHCSANFSKPDRQDESPADIQAASCFHRFKQSWAACLRLKSEEISAGKINFESISSLISWEADLNREKYTLLRRLGLISDYTTAQSSQASATGLLVPTSLSLKTKSNDLKKGRAKLLSSLNNGAEHHLMFWGDTRHGKAGIKGTDILTVPTFFSGGPFKSVALSNHAAVAVDGKGQVFAWGRGDMLGSQGIDRHVPLLLKNLSQRIIVQVASGDHHCLCLAADGTVLSWVGIPHQGSNDHGQLGTAKVGGYRAEPQPVARLMTEFVRQLSCGPLASGAITGMKF
jgi:hypothetical protein